MASNWTNGGLKRLLDGSINLTSDTIKVLILSAAYVPTPDHEFLSDVATYEVSGTGYVSGFGGSGRKTLAGKTFAKDDTLNEATFDATDPVWAGADFGVAGYLAVGKEVTSNADSPLLAVLDLGGLNGPLTKGGSFTVQFSTYLLRLRA